LLNTHSFFSFGGGASSPSRLVERAKELGYEHLALTDLNGVYGAVELHESAKRHGLTAGIGATVQVDTDFGTFSLPLLAANRNGYRVLNELCSIAHERGGTVTLPILEAHAGDVHALTGGRNGFLAQLLGTRKHKQARALLTDLKGVFPQRLWVQLFFEHYPADRRRTRYLRRLSREERLPAVAAPEVRYATTDLMPLYDALVCARLGLSTHTPERTRPQNDGQAIPDPYFALAGSLGEVALLLPDVLENTEALAETTTFELLPDRLYPPKATVPNGLTAEAYLEQRCYRALLDRYRGAALAEARERLEHELSVVRSVGFTEFFLVAAEITDYCRSRGILASGRGSAAASILCYLLGITQADPVEHDLLFERFLHGGRRSPPDIDIDISSSRRDEVLAWVEERFGPQAEAMVCNRITYYLPLAVQDLGRALGIPPEVRNRLSKALGRQHRHQRPHQALEALEAFDEVLGDAPVKETLMRLLRSMEPKFVRHIAPHSGGVILSREPLIHYSPVERSSGGIRLIQFDKDDTEALGLIKLDLLGLRMLGAIERTREEVYRTEGVWLEVRDPSLEDAVWRGIQEGDTMGLFQVESPAQVRMSVQLQPETLTDLAHQVALVRPGPIQSHAVHPYVRRRRGLEAVKYLHESLKPILKKTYGVLLFQEDLMRIAVQVAGMDWVEAEKFRKRVTTFEDEREIRDWHRTFIEGAIKTSGCSAEESQAIFDMMASFRGYGFAESHAWAFALHAYTSAWLRHHHPAEFLASLMTEHPGMWSHSTLRQEAKRYGIPFGRLDINRSGMSYLVEREGDHKRLRPPLTAVKGVGEEAAREILFGRLAKGSYRDVRDVYERVRVKPEALEGLARAGAFGRLQDRRDALFQARALRNLQPVGEKPLFTTVPESPPLEALAFADETLWDYVTKGFSEVGVHIIDLMRQRLRGLGATPLAACQNGWVRTAGLIIAKQKPGTAKGFAFYMLEDGPVRMQVVISPQLWERELLTLRDAKVLVVEGWHERTYQARTLRADRLFGLDVPTAS
jgi:error-prone DNA polymerase